MPDAMIVLPRTATEEDAHEVLLDTLERRAEQAMWLAEELRSCGAQPSMDAMRLARALRRSARIVLRALELDDDVSSDDATTLLGALQLQVDEAERMVLAADIRLAVDDASFARVEQSATAIGQLATVGFAACVAAQPDVAAFVAVEREAPVPCMHALQRVAAEGYLRGCAEPVPPWLSSMLGRTLGELLEQYRNEPDRSELIVSPFMRAAVAACGQVADRWWNEASIPVGERHGISRTETIDAVLATLELQRERLGTLPDLAPTFDAGFAYGLIEPLLDEHAIAQDFHPPRAMHAAHWFDLLITSPC
jgi:hypothetical protein